LAAIQPRPSLVYFRPPDHRCSQSHVSLAEARSSNSAPKAKYGGSFGIIFDVIQCLIQRDFAYATKDIRDAYVEIKAALIAPKHKKVVLIVHSQGGIIGSLIVDWLLDEVPQDLLHKLEVYTFASASNHFNNPYRGQRGAQAAAGSALPEPHAKAIRYIEHYANSEDFVSKWGVLEYIRHENRFMGVLIPLIHNYYCLNIWH
jgi:hypothetical protein